MTTMTFDPTAFKATTKRQWDEAAEAWDSWGATIEAWLGAATSADAWAEIEAELVRFEDEDGFVGPCELLVAAGTKP